MDFDRLEYIKNVNDDNGWAYSNYLVASYFRLNFKRSDTQDVLAHALSLPKGSLIILSQSYHGERYLTHVVELVNEGSEDEPQQEEGTWGIFRWVKVHWVADFNCPDNIPLDKDVMQVKWGWYDTKAKLLTSPGLMSQWKTIENLRDTLQRVFNVETALSPFLCN
ncbi:unknown protein [Calothrix sp. PCC 7716]|nr:unknown protein [Calothrix sp. PCC 7716]